MKKDLGLKELVAIAIGGMVGGGIFTVLGISVKMVGLLAPFAILIGGILAFVAAYSYVKLGVYYKDEGATYAFFRRTFSHSHLASAFIGWYTIFGYISTLALYSYTFSSYATGAFTENELIRKAIAILIIWFFALINLKSVKDMGKLEDVMVYIKLAILFVISFALIYVSKYTFGDFLLKAKSDYQSSSVIDILIVSSVTFVAYEGFQLVINGVNDMTNPDKNIPRAIYIAVILVALIYFFIALGAVLAVDVDTLAKYQEFALAYGAKKSLGNMSEIMVVLGAILATGSAINSTLFGSSHQMARIADDGYMPAFLSKRKATIPTNAITSMAFVASILIIVGGLKLILEFGSVTFLIVSLLMAYANFTIRKDTQSNTFIAATAIVGLFMAVLLIFYYEFITNRTKMEFIIFVYVLLSLFAYIYSMIMKKAIAGNP
jgi:amino acid transporter